MANIFDDYLSEAEDEDEDESIPFIKTPPKKKQKQKLKSLNIKKKRTPVKYRGFNTEKTNLSSHYYSKPIKEALTEKQLKVKLAGNPLTPTR